jgi:hypothetical protein
MRAVPLGRLAERCGQMAVTLRSFRERLPNAYRRSGLSTDHPGSSGQDPRTGVGDEQAFETKASPQSSPTPPGRKR